MSTSSQPIVHVVAGPNGSGKSTFALRYLPRWAADVARRFDRSASNLRAYADAADRVLVFDARPLVPELIWRRNGAESAFDSARTAAMKKGLGL